MTGDINIIRMDEVPENWHFICVYRKWDPVKITNAVTFVIEFTELNTTYFVFYKNPETNLKELYIVFQNKDDAVKFKLSV